MHISSGHEKKQKNNGNQINTNQQHIESSTRSSNTTLQHHQQSLLTNLNVETSKDEPSYYRETQLQNDTPKWQPTIPKTSRLPAYINKKKITRRLTFDRIIYSKRKFITPTNTQPQTTKQNILESFGIRQKVPTKIPKLPQ